MITDTIDAWQVERGDFVTLGGEEVFEVADAEVDDNVSLALRNDDGEVEVFHFLDTDPITLVVSLDDPESVEVD